MLKINSESGTEPVTLAEAKLWLKLDGDLTEDDTLIQMLLSDARLYVENYTGRAMKAKNVTVRVEAPNSKNKLPLKFTAASSGLVVTYYSEGSSVVLGVENYSLNEFENTIELKYNKEWPTSADYYLIEYDVVVEATEQMKKAILSLMACDYEYRKEGKQPRKTKINYVLDQVRIWDFQ